MMKLSLRKTKYFIENAAKNLIALFIKPNSQLIILIYFKLEIHSFLFSKIKLFTLD